MYINFDTNNLIVFQYPTGAGGKFVAACCGLSDGMVLGNEELARQQARGRLSKKDKLQYLLESMKDTSTWNDFGLGCRQLFGIALDEYDKVPSDTVEQRIKLIIARLQLTDLRYPVVAHTPYVCKLGVSKWTNARVVQFINNQEFYARFRPDQAWRDEQAPLDIPNDIFQWDQICVLEFQSFVQPLKELYNWLGLSDFDKDSISVFYHSYINTMHKLYEYQH